MRKISDSSHRLSHKRSSSGLSRSSSGLSKSSSGLSKSSSGLSHGSSSNRKKQILSLLYNCFFVGAIYYDELLLRICNKEGHFFGLGLFRTLFFSIAWGLALFLLIRLIRDSRIRNIVSIIILALNGVFFCIQICCKNTFGTYYNVGFMKTMTGDLLKGFGGTIFLTIIKNLIFIILVFLPIAAYILLKKKIWRRFRNPNLQRKRTIQLIIILVAAQFIGFMVSNFGLARAAYRYDFSANSAIPQFGEMTSLRLEFEYAIFGMPKKPLVTVEAEEETEVKSSVPEARDPNSYGNNEVNIDWEAVKSRCTSDEALGTAEYFSSITPSRQNDYTGYFQGKNLIHITAEAFSPYVVSREHTPTLYRLTHEGFVFKNYYQPDWGQSTIGGEITNLTGIVPYWYDGKLTANISADDYMPLALGTQFNAVGYHSVAYHNHDYDFYNRNNIHPNLGYDYKGIGNGLELESDKSWPASDLEMWEKTLPDLINDYKTNGQRFNAYYMTVSMHGSYDDWDENDMAAKHKEEALQYWPDLSLPNQVYMASALELEAGLTYMVEQLEAAGIAEDTVIAMTADHYPYFLSETSDGKDYYNELRGMEDTLTDPSRYINSFILWNGGMETPIEVDTPCCAIDILPTISNMFNLDYDSRLLSGRDIMATNYEPHKASTCMPLVIFPEEYGNSWMTDAGFYNNTKEEFIPNAGVTVDEDYVSTVNQYVLAKIDYATYLIGLDFYRTVFPDGFQPEIRPMPETTVEGTDAENADAEDASATEE